MVTDLYLIQKKLNLWAKIKEGLGVLFSDMAWAYEIPAPEDSDAGCVVSDFFLLDTN
ncbi:MAG: hypothetical protein AAFW00_01900 [Bacteroidota bacterium]